MPFVWQVQEVVILLCGAPTATTRKRVSPGESLGWLLEHQSDRSPCGGAADRSQQFLGCWVNKSTHSPFLGSKCLMRVSMNRRYAALHTTLLKITSIASVAAANDNRFPCRILYRVLRFGGNV